VRSLRRDVRAVFERDPAARSTLEVILCYPGFHALQMHRIAHWLLRLGLPLLARVVSHVSRFLTGIEIHPGARIGPGFFIDHGMGVVIGETAEIGEDVTLYQGVVLGGTGKEKGKRHPTIGDRVTVSAGAIVLGDIRVGHDSRIGAGAVVIGDVPPNATVVGVPGRVVRLAGRKVGGSIDLEHGRLPDPLEQRLLQMEARLRALEEVRRSESA